MPTQGDIRTNQNCPDGYEHWMSTTNSWMCGRVHGNSSMGGYRKVNKNINIDSHMECSTTDDCINGKNCILGECV